MPRYTFHEPGPDGVRVWDLGSNGSDVGIDDAQRDGIVLDRHQVPWLIESLTRWLAATEAEHKAAQAAPELK